jgi:hypothetical protein
VAKKTRIKKPGIVRKIIESQHAPEKAEISIADADELYREIRIENSLTDDQGNEVKLKPGAHVDVVVEANAEDTAPKEPSSKS